MNQVLTINNHKFILHSYSSELSPDWDILCPICKGVVWERGAYIDVKGLLGWFEAYLEIGEWNYTLFCSIHCQELYELIPLAYEV